jgi:hypothetical protein
LGGVLSDVAAQTGIAAGNVAILRRAFEDAGVGADAVGATINKLQKAISAANGGSEKSQAIFSKLGIKLSDISRLSPDEQFAAVAKAIAAIPDPAQRAAASMELFGKSGGKLLAIFQDGGALTGAGEFIGTQAEILNRQAGVFDSVSDKLGRIPDKLAGFFVGVLDPIAGDIDSILTKFEETDFAAIGQAFGEKIPEVVAGVYDFANGAYKALQIFLRIGEVLGNTFGLFFSGEYWKNVGDLISGAFMGAVERLQTGLDSVLSGDGIAMAFKKMLDTNAGDTILQNAANNLVRIYEPLIDSLTRPLQNLPSFNLPASVGSPASGGSSSPTPTPSASVPQIDGSKYGPGRDQFKPAVFGPSKDLMSGSGRIAAALRQRSLAEGAAGFGGLAGRSMMQYDRIMGNGPGQNTMLSNKGGRWSGVANESVTGGLGEKRRLRTSKDDRDAKKAVSIQEKQVGVLESIDSKVSQALTVA